VFEAELSLQTIGRTAQQLAPALDADARLQLHTLLSALRLGRDDEAESLARGLTERADPLPTTDRLGAARVQALAAAAIDTATVLRAGLASGGDGQLPTPHDPFYSPVQLTGGNLVGSGQTSAAAVAPGQDDRLARRLHLDAPARTAIRVMIAVGAASAAGSWLSERRFYWAVIAVFIAFMGANTAGEQMIKAVNRVAGTVVGILLGSLIATAVGPGTWSLAVILPALAIGVYFQRVSYALMVTGITVMVAQLYVLLGEYSNSLLILRLQETAIGAAIAILASLLILPVRTRRATRFAVGSWLQALGDLLAHLIATPDQDNDWGGHSGDQRALDDAFQQLLATARPLAHDPFHSRENLERTLGLIDTASYYARTVTACMGRDLQLDPQPAGELRCALGRQRQSVCQLAAGVRSNSENDGYQSITTPLETLEGRLAAEEVTPEDPRRRCIRALTRLDQTLLALNDELCSGPQPAGRAYRTPTPAVVPD
jgi:uncharacterized membrane protein YccC